MSRRRRTATAAGAALPAAFVLTAAVVCCAPVVAADLPVARPEAVGLDSGRLARLDAAMRQAVAERRVAGVVTLVARRGRVAHYAAHGMADVASNRPLRRDAMFRLYSMTKPVVSVALLMLYEEGKFQLGDPLENYIPSFANAKVLTGVEEGRIIVEEPRRKPTVHDAFRHTAGLASGLGASPVDERYRELGLTIDKLESLSAEVELLGTVPLLFHPGERWVYGLNHDVQAYLVEHFSGMPLDEFLRTRLFEPLGMEDTAFGIPPDRAERFATSYARAADGEVTVRETATSGPYTRFTARPFGTFGLSSTAMAYARFAQMLLNGGELDGVRVLGSKTVELMRQDHLPTGVTTVPPFAPRGSGYGLGVSVTLDPAAEGNLDSRGSFGWSGASTTKFYVDPEEQLVAVIMAQQTPFDAGLLDQFQTLVYQAIVD